MSAEQINIQRLKGRRAEGVRVTGPSILTTSCNDR
ncbi:hypothetical protein E2C01_067186 [Portunus trituberculatus]|uniref:Uncharacterized protein n=1 Tax=Portunus trituberculatus TaxID=210409 RepID=A0A5B7HNG1_PORTR|nr:hypothetical protein [Portunus trituberculatus]